MLYLYTGSPGSGKSFHATWDIYNKLKRKKDNTVICNFNIFTDKFNHHGRFFFVENDGISVDFFRDFAITHHDRNREAQTLVVLDEAGYLFNSRDYGTNSKKRMEWIKFFSQHRKLGYNFILIAQYDRAVDKQIRTLVEYEIAHMKLSNYFRLLPFTAFLCVERWYLQRVKIGTDIILYRKSIANLYDTYAMFDKNIDGVKQAREAVAGVGGSPTTAPTPAITTDILQKQSNV